MQVNDVEAAVRAVEVSYDREWNDGNLEGILDCLTPDAVLVNPRGQTAVGREQVRAVLSAFLATEAQGTEHHSEILRVSIMSPEVAVVDGVATITRGPGAVLVAHPFTDVLSCNEEGWRIAHVRAYAFMEE